MAQHDSDELKNELTRLLAKSRQLRDRSGTLDEEIQRLTRIIAGTADPEEASDYAARSAAQGRAAQPDRVRLGRQNRPLELDPETAEPRRLNGKPDRP